MKALLHFLLAAILLMVPCLASPIESGQAIEVQILGVPPGEQSRVAATYSVSDDGFVNMWQIGRIKAAGLSTDALARKIEAAYRAAEIYTSPTIQVMSNSSDRLVQQLVTVGGKVRSPGAKPYQRNMTLYQAVMAAGGATEFGAVNRVKLYRDGDVSTYDLRRAKDKLLKVEPNDVVDVPQKNVLGR
ncbi:MAG: hypothetical protein HKN82_17510 [Akkermansiaceae bacterium]|nr:hypothetical protein [Akkermansiaceae bacterium]